MKKILPFVKSFVLTFALHLSISLISNCLLDDYEPIGRTIISSLLFVVLYHIILNLVAKVNQDSEN